MLNIATGTDSLSKADRDSTKVPATTASKVTVATDIKTCDKAVQALNAQFATPGLARQVYVIKIDVSFAVMDPTVPGQSVYIYDRRWAPQSAMIP